MKFRMYLEETVTFRHEVVVECKDEEAVDRIAARIEEDAFNQSDIDFLCADEDITLVEFCEDGSGEAVFECTDIVEVRVK